MFTNYGDSGFENFGAVGFTILVPVDSESLLRSDRDVYLTEQVQWSEFADSAVPSRVAAAVGSCDRYHSGQPMEPQYRSRGSLLWWTLYADKGDDCGT